MSTRSWLWAAVSKLKIVAILSNIWLGVEYQKVEDSFIFPMGIYLPSSDQWFGFYDFLHDNGFAENCNTGQIAVFKEN
jgi:hypothetical protein